ncbi:MAG: HAD family hydrolase [Deltaproteobacteria bacterium]|nr:HAD family hydrolase [Deltaproteobacteria bacterium]
MTKLDSSRAMFFPKALLFDLDGTLIDSEAAICDSASAAFLTLGRKVDSADIADHLGAPLIELFQLFYLEQDPAPGGEELLKDPVFQDYLKAYIHEHDLHPESEGLPLPGVLSGLEALETIALPKAVATTKPTHRAEPHIQNGPLKRFFKHVQGTNVGMKPKPKPDVLFAACAALDVDVTETWMIGDTQRDVSAAIATGAWSVAIAYSDERYAQAEEFGADIVIRSIGELVELLLTARDK